MNKKRDIVDRRKTTGERIFFIVFFCVLAVWCTIVLYMLFWAGSSGFKTNLEYIREPLKLPEKLQWGNFKVAMEKLNHNGVGFWGMLWNSIWLVVGSTFLGTLSIIITGYIFGQYEFKGKNFLISHFLPTMTPEETPGLFKFVNCNHLQISGLKFDTDHMATCQGRVVAKNIEENTYDFLPEDGFSMSGIEKTENHLSYDEELSCDYHLQAYERAPYEVLENGAIRFHMSGYVRENYMIQSMPIGQRVGIRYTYYGKAILIFKHCNSVCVEDVIVHSCPGFAVLIEPRCSDFTFRCFQIRMPEGEERLTTSNADGLHVVGLTGKLILEDCYFEQVGDDSLNMHSLAASVDEIDSEQGILRCIRGYTKGALDDAWADTGDKVYVYDADTFLKKGEMTVIAFESNILHTEDDLTFVSKGDILANSAFAASVHVDNCTFRNSWARALLLQTEHVLVENCKFFGISLSAILITPDIRRWFEVMPASDIVIRNNYFEKCAFAPREPNLGVINVKVSHDGGYDDNPSGVHKNISVVCRVSLLAVSMYFLMRF